MRQVLDIPMTAQQRLQAELARRARWEQTHRDACDQIPVTESAGLFSLAKVKRLESIHDTDD